MKITLSSVKLAITLTWRNSLDNVVTNEFYFEFLIRGESITDGKSLRDQCQKIFARTTLMTPVGRPEATKLPFFHRVAPPSETLPLKFGLKRIEKFA